MLLNTSRCVGSLWFVLSVSSVIGACSSKDGTTLGDPATTTGGSPAGSGGVAQVGGTSSSVTGTTSALTGGTQSAGGTSNATGGKSGMTGGSGTATTTSSKATGGNGGATSSVTGVGGALTGGTRSTGGTSNNTAGTGTNTTSEATGGSTNGGGATGGTGPAGGTSSAGNASAGTSAGGTQTTGGTSNAGGTGVAGAATGGGGSQFTIGACTLGEGTQEGSGQTDVQFFGANVKRNSVNYKMITNGWGDGWVSHDISWLGTSLSINEYEGSRQSDGAPAGFPTVFCGRYSDTSLECGLPRALANIKALNTAVSWTQAVPKGVYNASYDVWLGDGATMRRGLQSYFMVWLHDPADEQPAGSLTVEGVTVADVPGKWNIITGTVNSLPIVNYVRAEGDDTHQIAFDIMDFIRDAQTRKFSMPGNDVLAVAFGFEIWSGSVTDLKIDDFCLDVQ